MHQQDREKTRRHESITLTDEGESGLETPGADKRRSEVFKRALRDLASKWRRERFQRSKKKEKDDAS